MAQATTRRAIRERAQIESGLRGSQYYTTADWNRFVQVAIEDYWRIVTRGDEGYGMIGPVTLFTTPGSDTVVLPADHQATRFLDRPTTGTNTEYRETENKSYRWWRESFQPLAEATGTDIERPGIYWYKEQTPINPTRKLLVLRPVPDAVEELLIRYVPVAPVLTNDDDAIDTIAGFDDYIVDFLISRYAQDSRRKGEAYARLQQSQTDLMNWDGDRDRQSPDLVVHYQNGWQYQR